RMSVRGIDKAKRELGFVLMALNIRKVTAQRAENNQKNNKKDNFYIISIEIVFFYLSWDFMSHTLAPKGSQEDVPGKPGVKNPDTGEVVTPPVDDVTKYGPVDGDPITST
ncbi:E domain-containing protein, partial [Staphylococcus epidermidis]|uniref:E domain-containing protein n=1 Tax=Staphylococcus epidermidis TaxID=1282 RepID=UPI0034DAEFAC